MRRLTILSLATAAAVAVPAATAPAAPATTLKLASGSTSLTLDPAAVANLQSMAITMSGVAPATTAGPLLKFPVTSGSLKVKGAKLQSGKIVHGGELAMTQVNPALPQPIRIALSKPTVNFAKPAVLTGALQGLAVSVADLDVSKVKVTRTKTAVKLTGVSARLTEGAASAMNALFSVTGFKAGDPIGKATISAKLKR